MNKIYYIDESYKNNVFDIENLPTDDSVREFIEQNFTPISYGEIENNKNEIINDYKETYDGKLWTDEFEYGEHMVYEDDIEYNDLLELEETLDDAKVLNKGDDIYFEIYNKAVKYGY